MKKFLTAYHTDSGIRKNINQDSLLLKGAVKDSEEILFTVLCDGMGGMAKGELASATVIRAFSEWFETVYLQKGSRWSGEEVNLQWKTLLEQVNEALIKYGKERQIHLGTTVTACLFRADGRYLAVHVGDTRIYLMNQNIIQLTEDHTLVAREIKHQSMTPEQAKADSRRNVLLQCIGVNPFFRPQYIEGFLKAGDSVLLCSDGFRHEVSEQEMYSELRNAENEAIMKQKLVKLVELNKQRNETDNITAIFVKRMQEN